MGDHKDDKTIEEILEEEAQKKAKEQAKQEAEALRYTVLVLYKIDKICGCVAVPVN